MKAISQLNLGLLMVMVLSKKAVNNVWHKNLFFELCHFRSIFRLLPILVV
jgi:hypothetical protein